MLLPQLSARDYYFAKKKTVKTILSRSQAENLIACQSIRIEWSLTMRRRRFIQSAALASLAAKFHSFPVRAASLDGQPKTLLQKIWDVHVITRLSDTTDLLHVDKHFIHDLHAGAYRSLARQNYSVSRPDLTYAVVDHSVSTIPGRTYDSSPSGRRLAEQLIVTSNSLGIDGVGINDEEQGIVHIIAPEYGHTLPGMLVVCGDSHTCTQGALGAMAWGIGSTEVRNTLISQSIIQRRPQQLRVEINGRLPPWVSAKDIILYTIGRFGADSGTGYAVEYTGSTVKAMSMEERLTLCNLSIEMGARIGMVAPDDTTFEYLAGKKYSPQGQDWDAALAYWQTLPTDDDAEYDKTLSVRVEDIEPQVTWGTSPEHVVGVSETIPAVGAGAGYSAALDYTGLTSGQPIEGTPIQRVFIGSCANSRISDLRSAAAVVEGRSVSPGVEAWVVPGSQAVKRIGESEGLDQIFLSAGFQWREPGCSMCLAANGERVAPGDHCVSTSNRNFVGRQGRDSITHLASPAMAAAAAITGTITDVRRLVGV